MAYKKTKITAISPLFMQKLDNLQPDTKKFFGGEKHGYKKSFLEFLDAVIQTGGEASAIARGKYNWWLYEEIKQHDPFFQEILLNQNTLMVRRAEEMLCYRAIHGYEEIVEESGVIVKRTTKISDRALLEFLKVHSDSYQKHVNISTDPGNVEIANFS